MRVHFVVHESFEPPGAYETWGRKRGFEITYSRVYEHQPLPTSAAGIDFLVVMGGPQSPNTTTWECPYFDARSEQALIAQCAANGKAVVGVCLGAQLLGAALGAPCAHSPEPEIGVFPILLTPDAKISGKFKHFGNALRVGHWHGDMPGLTDDAKIIAYSEGCPRQIVEYGDLVYGLQCHLEFSRDGIKRLIAASNEELSRLRDRRFVSSPAALCAENYGEMNQKLFGFLDHLVSAYSNAR